MKKILPIAFLAILSFVGYQFLKKNSDWTKNLLGQSSSVKSKSLPSSSQESINVFSKNKHRSKVLSKPFQRIKETDLAWKKKLYKNLMRFHSPHTRVLIQKLSPQTANSSQSVLITYHLPSGRRNSFKAIVDLKSGKILKTWGRTIHEDFRKKQQGLSPDGFL